MIFLSQLTSKVRTTVLKAVREASGARPDDVLAFGVERGVTAIEARSLDCAYLRSIERSLGDEWLSQEDEATFTESLAI